MKPLKERKTLLQSKKRVVSMMNLFEKYVDEPIISIDLQASTINTGKKYEWWIDVAKNEVIQVYPDPE